MSRGHPSEPVQIVGHCDVVHKRVHGEATTRRGFGDHSVNRSQIQQTGLRLIGTGAVREADGGFGLMGGEWAFGAPGMAIPEL